MIRRPKPEPILPPLCSRCKAMPLRTIGSTGVRYCPHCDTVCLLVPCVLCQTVNTPEPEGEPA